MTPQSAQPEELVALLASCPDALCDLLLELRDLLLSVLPDDADELVRWNALCYCKDGKPVRGSICGLGWRDDYVEIGFVHGAFLHDPKGLLEGDRKAKRHIRVRSMREVPVRALKALIREAVRFDPAQPPRMP